MADLVETMVPLYFSLIKYGQQAEEHIIFFSYIGQYYSIDGTRPHHSLSVLTFVLKHLSNLHFSRPFGGKTNKTPNHQM